MKAMLAHILFTYDVKFENEGVRPPNQCFATYILPDPTAKVMFRKRQIWLGWLISRLLTQFNYTCTIIATTTSASCPLFWRLGVQGNLGGHLSARLPEWRSSGPQIGLCRWWGPEGGSEIGANCIWWYRVDSRYFRALLRWMCRTQPRLAARLERAKMRLKEILINIVT